MQHADIRAAVYLTVHEFPAIRDLKPVESAALTLGRAAGTLYNKADPGNDSQGLLLEEAAALIRASKDYRILHAFCAACDHAAVPLGDFRGTSDAELLDLFAASIVAAGDTATEIRRALQDRRITGAELRLIRAATYRQVCALFELMSRLEALSHAA